LLAGVTLAVLAAAVIALFGTQRTHDRRDAAREPSANAVRAHSAVLRRPAPTPRPGRRDHRIVRLRPSTAAVPILMYHVLADPPAGAPFPQLYVRPAEFAAQMRAVDRAGYHAVTLDRVRRAWLGRAKLPAKPMVVSFDNGYRTQYTQALPILRRLGWVGVENIQLTGLPPAQGGLGKREVRGLLAAGWELDTQGWSHAELSALDAAQLHFQVAVARRLLQREYHVPVNWFCYPSGGYDPAVIAAVKSAGYVGATTVVPGWAHPGDDRYRLPRLRVIRGTSPQELLGQIAGSAHDTFRPASYGPRA
jgi:peptidoglycan/xylan/chitin deacetylase (PgdA/CDA1 family)